MRNVASVSIRKLLRRARVTKVSTKDDTREHNKDAISSVTSVITSTNADLSQSRSELAFFLASILFVLVTTLSISDRDLLFGSRVQLPLLGLTMSFDAFLL